MMVVEPEDTTRKRKSHKKSRGGCANCKLRRVKCDENKPQCSKCEAFGVSCSYEPIDSDHGELQLMAGEEAFRFGDNDDAAPATIEGKASEGNIPFMEMEIPPSPPSDLHYHLLGKPIALHETDEVYHITEADLETMRRCEDRTIYTVGTAHTCHIYREKIFELACSHDYYMHVILTMTLMHDRYLLSDQKTPPTAAEAFHWYHGLGLFQKALSEEIKDEDRDALWGTSALLGCCTVANIEHSRAEDCWPFAPPRQSDLDWLEIGAGKKEVWRLTNPLREDSVWKEAMSIDLDRRDRLPESPEVAEMRVMFPYLIRIDEGDPNEDPYQVAGSMLLRLLKVECTYSTVMFFLAWLGHMEPRFRHLLHAKDPWALLLMAWWQAKMLDYPVWWNSRRAYLECRSICMYLEQTLASDHPIRTMLDYPKMQSGLTQKTARPPLNLSGLVYPH